MELHLIRHADAEVQREGLLDSDRTLTLKGHQQSKALRDVLKKLEVRYDMMLVSPLARAQETANALERLADALETTELLAMPPGRELLEHLRSFAPNQARVALVGHQPYLSELAGLLLFGNEATAPQFEFKKSGLYAVEWPVEPRLLYALTPSLTRKLAE